MRQALKSLARRSRRRLDEFAVATSATAAIEFAYTVPIFIVLSMGILYVGVTFLAKQHLETVAENVAYQVMINSSSTTGLTQTQFQNYVCNNLSGLFDCSKVMVDMQLASGVSNPYPTFTYNSQGQITNSWAYNPPTTTTDVMMLRLMYPWPVISLPFGIQFGDMTNGNLLIMSVQVFEVEPT